jgi:hypothetical protein
MKNTAPARNEPPSASVDEDLFVDEAAELRNRNRTIAETRERMAHEGDVAGLWQVLTETPWAEFDQAKVFQLLLRAIDAAVRKDPVRFSEDAFAGMAGFGVYLILRGEFYVRTLIAQQDASGRSRRALSLPDEVVDMLPRLVELQQHVGAILEAQARAARMWGLAGTGRRRTAGAPPEADVEGVVTDEAASAAADLVGAAAQLQLTSSINGQPAHQAGQEVFHGDGAATGSTRRGGPMATNRGSFPPECPHLMRQGTIVAKKGAGRRTWVLRFVVRCAGRTVHRSAFLCRDDEPALLERARALLRRCRARGAWFKELVRLARLAGAARAAVGRW